MSDIESVIVAGASYCAALRKYADDAEAATYAPTPEERVGSEVVDRLEAEASCARAEASRVESWCRDTFWRVSRGRWFA